MSSMVGREQGAMKSRSHSAPVFIGLVVTFAAVMVARSISRMQPLHGFEFVSVLCLALLASRMRIKLPGLSGNMSVNLPFILFAVVQLSLFEALLIAVASTVAQCFPKKGGGKPKPIQVLFNVSTMAIAVGLGGLIFQGRVPLRFAWFSGSLLVALAGTGFFLAQTIPVATIISLTEGGSVARIWSNILHLSFPYYVLSAGITSIVTTASRLVGWQVPLLLLPVMYGVYRSYKLYFGSTVASAGVLVMAKGAGD
jgi:hypothetical protein